MNDCWSNYDTVTRTPMSPLDMFTVVTGLASLFGFVVQIFDFFPRFGQARERVFLVFLGVFVGSLARAVSPGSIRFNFEFTGFSALVTVYGTALIALAFTGALIKDQQRRGEIFAVSAAAFAGFLFVIFFGYLLISAPAVNDERNQLTIHELDSLARQAVDAKDYERAEMHLRSIEFQADRSGRSSPPRYRATDTGSRSRVTAKVTSGAQWLPEGV